MSKAGERQGETVSGWSFLLPGITFIAAFTLGVLVRGFVSAESKRGSDDREEKRLRTILDNIPVALGVSDAKGEVEWTNSHVERVWAGSNQSSGVDEYREYRAWWPETGVELAPDDWTSYRALKQDQPIYGEVLEIERFDGTHGFVLSSAVPLHAADGELIGSVGVTEDITQPRERMRLSEALNEIGSVVHSSLATDEVLTSMLDLASTALRADSSGIAVRVGNRWRVVYGHGHAASQVLAEYTDEDFPAAAEAHRTGDVVVMDRWVGRPGHVDGVSGETMSIPLLVRDEVMGVVSFMRHEDGGFSSEQRDFGRQLGSMISLALENARLFEEQERQSRFTEQELATRSLLLRSIGALNETIGLNDTLERLAEYAAEAVGVERAVVLLYRQDVDMLEVVASCGDPTPRSGQWMPLSHAQTMLGAATRGGEARVIDFAAEQVPHEMRESARSYGMSRVLYTPMMRDGRLLGALSLDEPGVHVMFDEPEIELAQAIASQAAVAIENAEMFEAQKEQAALGVALNEINAMLRSAEKPEEVIAHALAMGVATVGANGGSVAMHETGEWVVRYQQGLGEDLLGSRFQEEDASWLEDALQSRGVLIPGHEIRPQTGLGRTNGWVIAVPLMARGRAFALMFFNWRDEEARPSPSQLDFTKRLGGSVALALENLRLFQEERRSARLAEALNRVNELLLGTLSVDEMLEQIVQQASQGTEADGTMLLRPQGNEWEVSLVAGLSPDFVGARHAYDFSEAVTAAVETRRPVFIEHAATDSRANPQMRLRYGLEAYIIVPLIAGKELVGAVYFGYRTPRHFDDSDIEFAERLSTAIALALRNASLYQSERLIAETLQDTLLVMPDRLPGIEFARFYRSATTSSRVGGDFIDAFPLGVHSVVVALGDVSGKGLEAAALTAMVRNTLRAYAVDGLPPVMVVDRTNALLRKFTSTETFVTLFYAQLDTSTGRMAYVSAGHPDSLIVSADSGVRRLSSRSPILGAFDTTSYVEGAALLAPGECLFAYSDGVTESRRQGEMYGEKRLATLLSQSTDPTPAAVIESVFAGVRSFSAGEFGDDIAMLALALDRSAADSDSSQVPFAF